MDLLRMRWRDVLFVHWPVDPESVTARLPDGLRAATHDGDAWLGVVGFEMAAVRPLGAPIGRSFPELNLRTYVSRVGGGASVGDDTDVDRSGEGNSDGDRFGEGNPDDDHGVYFFSLDAPDRVGVTIARRLFRLPYYRAEMRLVRDEESMALRSRRTHPDAPAARFEATYRRTGSSATPELGTLEHFLTENYRFYTDGVGTDRDRLYCGDVDHSTWSIADATAEIESNTLFAANGFEEPASGPVVHYSPGVDVRAAGLNTV